MSDVAKESDQHGGSAAFSAGAAPAEQVAAGLSTVGSDIRTQAISVAKSAASLAGVGADLLAALLLSAAELYLAFVAYRADFSFGIILIGHSCLVALFGYWIYRKSAAEQDISLGLLTLLGTVAMGPLGAVGGVIAILLSRLGSQPAQLLSDWYDRISHSTWVDPVTRQCDTVAIGRAMNLTGAIPASYRDEMHHGSLEQKQNALGLIARKFHLDYLPALNSALKSEQPVIRVQAAAVAAHVRNDIQDQLYDMIKEEGPMTHDPEYALHLAGAIERCIGSGLLDEADVLLGQEAADRLYDQALQSISRGATDEEAGQSATNGADGQKKAGFVEKNLSAGHANDDEAGQSDHNPKLIDAALGGNCEAWQARAHMFDLDRQDCSLRRVYEALLLRRGQFDLFRQIKGELAQEPAGYWRLRSLTEAHALRVAGARRGEVTK